jgi:tetratricopeptide (TPR) repeat protein
MMKEVLVWEEEVIIPTYEIGEPEEYPMFLDKRVYQGSSGKVYPYPTVETIYDIKVDKAYKAVYLENVYLKIMILPELGGRIQRAYDKTNQYDFVYYNQVIKPALVGLTGPWISGGIEFNWPQHHRPTTFSPVDYTLQENSDGSKTVLVHDVDQMYGTKGIAKFTLYPDKAYIEIEGQLYNRTPYPQTFLWWANPAVAVNDHTQSIFPPDVHAVMDHGKRDVSRFPIATGVYYKQDYSEGVDISRYKNIPVPTSYMAEKSDYNFVGGYDYSVNAGILHVADHHISPGKKQWTWGCGDFGKAWDRNLTDEDGPYIELMTGVYTDNQPDFTWLKPFEEKSFKQYFMPYKGVGEVKNASTKAAINLVVDENQVIIKAYVTSAYENVKIILKNKSSIVFETEVSLSPIKCYETTIEIDSCKETDLSVEVRDGNNLLVDYTPKEKSIEKIPEPAKPTLDPTEVLTNEELYLSGLHLEQYRHATFKPEDYYLEGLKRDGGDVRINNAYGTLLMRRGEFEKAKKHFETAIHRLTKRNPNPYNSEPYYNLGLVNLYLGDEDEAYDAFYKATWSNEQQEMSFYYLATIDAKRNEYESALELVEKGLIKNSHNIKARGLKAYILRKLGRQEAAKGYVMESLAIDPFDYVSRYELAILVKEQQINLPNYQNYDDAIYELNSFMRDFADNYLMVARDYGEFGGYKEGIEVLNLCKKNQPLLKYYEAYYYGLLGEKSLSKEALKQAETYSFKYCFPNKIEDIFVLLYAIKENELSAKAYYYLGNLYYDKSQWEKATKLWEQSIEIDTTFPIPYRNLALSYYNKNQAPDKAKKMLEHAFLLDKTDARVFLELDQLNKKLGVGFKERLSYFEQFKDNVLKRDDLYIEYVTLLNMVGEHKKAYDLIMERKFHPWEGGEGKITTAYTISLVEQAKESIRNKQWDSAYKYLMDALVYPDNLGEGKLAGTNDNHIYYYLGVVLEGQGDLDGAKEFFMKASLGNSEPTGMMFYNDQPADMILFQGLAYLKLGNTRNAKERFNKLLDYGEQHVYDEVKMDYFAVSLPDFLIFDDNLTAKNKAHCYYLMALSKYGQGNVYEALEFLDKALSIEHSHIWCYLYKRELEVLVNIPNF